MPARPATAALYVSEPPPTLVTLRVTVCTPARSPMAIDAPFRLLGSMRVNAEQKDAWLGAADEVQPVVVSRVEDEPGIHGVVRPHVPGTLAEDHHGIGVRTVEHIDAVVISADLIAIGDQSGCSSLNSAARPATCGLDIDVPLKISNSRPLLPPAHTPPGCPVPAR